MKMIGIEIDKTKGERKEERHSSASGYINLSSLFPVGRAPMGICDFTDQVDRVYPGLGIPTLYGVLSILANKSVFYIAGRGTGKTRIINLIPDIETTRVFRCDTFTLEELNSLCRALVSCSGYVENEHLVFKVEEFSTLSDYHREIFLTVCSKIVSDGNYTHVTSHTPFLDIRNCGLSMQIAIQPELYSRLCRSHTAWESMSYDRFSKFLLLNPLRSGTINVDFVPTLPRKIGDNATFQRTELSLDRVVSMYRGQASEGRAFLYAQDYVTALARFLNSPAVKQEHVDTFFDLFHPYLNTFSILQKARDLDCPVEVSSGKLKLLTEIAKYKEPVEKKKLAEDLYVTERHIERCAADLIQANLIERPKPAQYCLSKNLRDYFQSYRNRLSFP